MKVDNKISILMPAKNADLYLRECLSSIISQSYLSWELIIINDHSTDQTKGIINDFAKKDKRIFSFDNEGTGIISALQMAYTKSRGSFISRMDADDVMSKDKLKSMFQKLQESGQGYVAVGLVSYFSNEGIRNGYKNYEKWLNYLTLNNINFSEIYKECCIPSPNWMMYKSDFEKCGKFNSDIYPEDYDLCFRILKAGLKVAGVQRITHFWRDHPARASRNLAQYSDNKFSDLKVKYFKDLHLDVNRTLVLWGAGPKGKSIAKELITHKIDFKWVTNNTNKIGQVIYGVIVENQEILIKMENLQLIIAISSPSKQKEIKSFLSNNAWLPNKDYFYFY